MAHLKGKRYAKAWVQIYRCLKPSIGDRNAARIQCWNYVPSIQIDACMYVHIFLA